MKKLDLNTSADLPSGSSTQGATDSSMGGASTADLERGYCESKAPDTDVTLETALFSTKSGVLGRPQGWER